ncbi:MAG: type II toxin-antitoxin system VapC family toxin [Chloroflexi bacterium]|nr:type II toxin-antitoxin system VapC family toxin [Chloroflexota bacterium]
MIDSSIIVSYLVESDSRHQMALSYFSGLENGDYSFHAPMLVPVEVAGVLGRREPLPNRLAILLRWQQTISDWEEAGKITLYPLNRDRMNNAVNITQQNRLRGADSIVAGLAQELDMPLKTFDQEILQRFQRASV